MSLGTITAGNCTNEQLMDQLDASRDPLNRVDLSSGKLKVEKYSGALIGHIVSCLDTMRIHMDQDANLPESLKMIKVVSRRSQDLCAQQKPWRTEVPFIRSLIFTLVALGPNSL